MENESLKLTAYHCAFKGVASAFEHPDDPKELGKLGSQALYKAIRRFQDDLAKQGLRLTQFFDAFDDPKSLQGLVRRSRNHDYAVRLQQSAMMGRTPEEVASLWCRDILASVFGQIRHRVVLPYLHKTKAEVVQQLQGQGLEELISESYSCVHGMVPQCGHCPGCLFRRCALIIAGFETVDGPYSIRIFGERAEVNALPDRRLVALKAILAQIHDLEFADDNGDVPVPMAGHLRDMFHDGEVIPGFVIDLLRRYRREWLQVIEIARARGYQWANMMPISSVA